MSRKQFFAGWEFDLDGSPESHRLFDAQHVTEEVAQFCFSYMELEFDDSGALIGALTANAADGPDTHGYGYERLQKSIAEGKHTYREYRVNQPFEFVRDAQGTCYLGGTPPEGFIMPKASIGFPFQYLGMLDKADAAFSLDFDMHLVCPIYLDYFAEIWLDYSDPLQPKIVNDDALEFNREHAYFNLVEGNEVVYEKIHFSTSAWPSTTRHGGHTGVATWIQGPQVPVCPKTGKTMRSICQLGDADLDLGEREGSIIPKTSVRNFTLPDDEYRNEKLDKMDFWGSGDLYVFYCDESRLACYLIQNT